MTRAEELFNNDSKLTNNVKVINRGYKSNMDVVNNIYHEIIEDVYDQIGKTIPDDIEIEDIIVIDIDKDVHASTLSPLNKLYWIGEEVVPGHVIAEVSIVPEKVTIRRKR